MLELRRQRTVPRHGRPSVGKDLHLRPAEIDHRFDGEDHPRLQRRAFAAAAIVQDVRHVVEQALVVFVTLLGLFSLVWGYRRHGALRALGFLIPGLVALWAGVLYDPLHHNAVPHAVVMTIGGLLVGVAHLVNLRLNHGHVHDASCAH